MKPIKVIMQAFGPYEARTECDFTKLNESKLFLITGQTGAGKTTILDALSFAIYGKATGELRSFKEMRNTTAPAELHTYVEAQIKIGDGVYKFVRDVNAAPSKVRKTGELKENWKQENSVYEFENGDWKLLHTGKDVDEFGKSVTGFTHQQFSQVIVLPQGEFKKLLTANSTEKEKILEVLFATTKWKNLTDKLCFMEKTLKGKLASFNEQVKGVLGANNAESTEELNRRVDDLKHESESAKESEKKASIAFEKSTKKYNQAVQTNNLFSESEKLTNEITILKARENEISETKKQILQIETGDKIYPYYKSVKKDENNIEKIKSQHEKTVLMLKDAKESYDNAQKELISKTSLQEKKNSLLVEQKELEEIAKLFDELKKCDLKVQQLSDEQIKKTGDKQKEEQNVLNLKDRVENGEAFVANIDEKFTSKLPGYKDELNSLNNFLTLVAKNNELKDKLTVLKGKITRENDSLQKLLIAKGAKENAVALMEEKIAEDAACKLATTLKDGERCPVCGSVSHPSPCKKAIETPSQDEVDTIKEELAKLVDDITKHQGEYNRLKGEENSVLDSVNENQVKMEQFGLSDGEAKGQAEALKAKIKEAETEIKNKPDYVRKIADFKNDITKSEERFKNIASLLESINSNLATAKANQANIQKSTGGCSKEQNTTKILENKNEINLLSNKITAIDTEYDRANTSFQELKAEEKTEKENIKKYTESLEKAENEYTKLCKELSVVASFDFDTYLKQQQFLTTYKKDVENYFLDLKTKSQRVSDIEKLITGKEKFALTEIKADLDKRQEEWKAAGAKLAEINSNIKNLTNALNQIDLIKEKFKEQEKEYKTVSTLSRLLRGDNELKTPIHQFVLGIMLEDIIKTANIYFSKLSKGQYSLVRMDVAGGRGYNGLELFVMDAQRGGTRTVNTLSGGELFIASLSLAFGLSDVVQAFAGGVYLDSIFIDEGFGTLDEETLDCAMKALTEIQKSGRMVGIISHVKELRERIAARIEITKDCQGGSKLEVIGI